MSITSNTSARIEPLTAPFPAEIAEILNRFPQGPEGPIALFRTLAHSPRALDKVGKAGLLDKQSPLTMREREIVILRTSANCHCEYEWGVHVMAFAKHVGFDQAQIDATQNKLPDLGIWSLREQLILLAADELSGTKRLSDQLWSALLAEFKLAEILEVIMLVGFYHSIAFLNNSLKVQNEAGTPRFN